MDFKRLNRDLIEILRDLIGNEHFKDLIRIFNEVRLWWRLPLGATRLGEEPCLCFLVLVRFWSPDGFLTYSMHS